VLKRAIGDLDSRVSRWMSKGENRRRASVTRRLDGNHSECFYVSYAYFSVSAKRLHRMHEMLTVLTDVHGVCLSVSLSEIEIKSCR